MFTNESRFQLYHAGLRQRVWRHVDEWFAHANVVPRVARGVVALWCGQASYTGIEHHCTSLKGTAQRYWDEFLTPIIVPFVRQYDINF